MASLWEGSRGFWGTKQRGLPGAQSVARAGRKGWAGGSCQAWGEKGRGWCPREGKAGLGVRGPLWGACPALSGRGAPRGTRPLLKGPTLEGCLVSRGFGEGEGVGGFLTTRIPVSLWVRPFDIGGLPLVSPGMKRHRSRCHDCQSQCGLLSARQTFLGC